MRKQLLANVAGSVALLVASGAVAQTVVEQHTTNDAPIDNNGHLSLGAGITGVGGSEAISATGAVSATSVTGINADFVLPNFGNVTQSATNTTAGVINNYNTLSDTLPTPTPNDIDGGGDFALGASAAMTATGALTAFSFSGIGTSVWNAPEVTGTIRQTSENAGTVTNGGAPTIGNFAGLGGAGSSASIGATGAAASAGLSFIGSGAVIGSTFGGSVIQSATNEGSGVTTNLDGHIPLGGPISGAGASASISATGAIASFSISHVVNTAGEGSFTVAGRIDQTAANDAPITNSGIITTASGGLTGPGTSAVVSATGAAASVSSSSIASAAPTLASPSITRIVQDVDNGGNVTNTGDVDLTGAISGPGAAGSVSAVGAGAYASFSAIASDPATTSGPPGTPTRIEQGANNTGTVTGTANDRVRTTGALSGAGAGAAVSTTGSAAATSIAGIHSDFGVRTLGRVDQDSTNSGDVTTPEGSRVDIGNHTTGAGASASVSATGALSSVSVTGIADIAFSDVTIGAVTQTTENSGKIEAGGASNGPGGWPTSSSYAAFVNPGRLRGAGASASVSATGAASAVSVTHIDAMSATTNFARVDQTTETTGGGETWNYGRIGTSGAHDGPGASISVSATSAISSVSNTAIGGTGSVGTQFGAVDQTTSTDGATRNFGYLNLSTGGHLSGDGVTAAISATGAASVVSSTAIGAVEPLFSVGNISQTTTTESGGTVQNVGQISHNGDLTGDGASTAISATGAISSASATAIGASLADVSFSNITQASTNNDTVRNDSRGLGVSIGFSGVDGIAGAGSSTSISASGAASVVSTAFINSTATSVEIGNVRSTATNNAAVTNDNSSTPNALNTPATSSGTGNLNIGVGGIGGSGASASVSASGATAALSISSIESPGNPADGPAIGSISVGRVTQEAHNNGTVTNLGGTITLSGPAGSISGTGASASISASGAASSVSVSSIADAGTLAGTTSITGINQTSNNTATVTNTGRIVATGGITGAGASASISAVGAGAYASFSSIKATP